MGEVQIPRNELNVGTQSLILEGAKQCFVHAELHLMLLQETAEKENCVLLLAAWESPNKGQLLEAELV